FRMTGAPIAIWRARAPMMRARSKRMNFSSACEGDADFFVAMAAPGNGRSHHPYKNLDPSTFVLSGVARRLRAVHGLYALLVFLPVGVVAARTGHATLGFAASSIALIPLAYVIGVATESLAVRLGHGLGSVVLATLSNSVELLLGYLALQKGLTRVVQAAITGSILANILLVLGTAMLAGGFRYRSQSFGGKAANVQATVLFLAVLALFLPALAQVLVKEPVDLNRMSVVLSIGLLLTYFLGLVFTLRTHRHLFE